MILGVHLQARPLNRCLRHYSLFTASEFNELAVYANARAHVIGPSRDLRRPTRTPKAVQKFRPWPQHLEKNKHVLQKQKTSLQWWYTNLDALHRIFILNSEVSKSWDVMHAIYCFSQPPKVKCLTRIWHPNIAETGEICLRYASRIFLHLLFWWFVEFYICTILFCCFFRFRSVYRFATKQMSINTHISLSAVYCENIQLMALDGRRRVH